jgi:predicted nucleic acid-binding protein
MAADALIDSGAIVAMLDKTDPWHRLCQEAFRQLHLPLLTSEAVLTEVFHFVGETRSKMENAWKFVRSGGLVLAKIDHDELPQIHDLMSQYWDGPMDFADATLVHLAKRESISAILTIDHDDFTTYRIEGKRRFKIFPLHRPLA